LTQRAVNSTEDSKQEGVSLASYPGLLTPVFVTCSTNMGEGLLELITCNDVPGHLGDMWRSGTFQEKLQVHVSECTIDCKHGP